MDKHSLPVGTDTSVELDVPEILTERTRDTGFSILKLSVGLLAIGIGLLGTDGTTKFKLGSFSGDVGTSELSVFASAALLATIAYFATLVNRDLKRFALANSEYATNELLRVVESKARVLFQEEVGLLGSESPEFSRKLAAERLLAKALKSTLPSRLKAVESAAHGWSSFALEIGAPLIAGSLGILLAATKAQPGLQQWFHFAGAAATLLFLIGTAVLLFKPAVFDAKTLEKELLESHGVEAGLWMYAYNIAQAEVPLNPDDGKFYGLPVEKRRELHDRLADSCFRLLERFEKSTQSKQTQNPTTPDGPSPPLRGSAGR